MAEQGKILIITDVHGKIREMIDFMNILVKNKNEKIDFAVHLGDFWSGRNYDPNTGEQKKDEFSDLSFFKNLSFPLFLLKGNEDLIQPDNVWHSNNLWLMKDQESFILNNWTILPIDYQYPGEPSDENPKHNDLSKLENIDFIFSHRPPYGMIDDTLHYKTHKKLKNTGSPMVRKYYNLIKPSLCIFGHFHYSNYLMQDCGLIVGLDKLIRLGGSSKNEFRYSYALLDSFDQSLEVFWKNQRFFKYSILEQKMSNIKHFDKRNLNSKKKKR